jgi:hypothetical protein
LRLFPYCRATETAGDAAEYCPVADIGVWLDAVVRLIEERRTG